MQDLGVTQLWLPPPSNSVSRQGYLPGQLYDLNTPYGTKEELMALLKQVRSAGIAPLADIVINHRCADKQDEMGTWNIFTYDICTCIALHTSIPLYFPPRQYASLCHDGGPVPHPSCRNQPVSGGVQTQSHITYAFVHIFWTCLYSTLPKDQCSMRLSSIDDA
jgi:Alpha amylase, catalytic domain